MKICTKCGKEKPLTNFYGKKVKYRRCKECVSAERKTDTYRASFRDWCSRNRDRRNKSFKVWRNKNPRPSRAGTKNFSRYGITEETWDKLYAEQNGKCRICGGVNADGRRLGVDHDDVTGIVRGLLCLACNFGIGYLKHNTSILSKAIQYLENNANITPLKKGRAYIERLSPSQIKRMPLSQKRRFGIE